MKNSIPACLSGEQISGISMISCRMDGQSRVCAVVQTIAIVADACVIQQI